MEKPELSAAVGNKPIFFFNLEAEFPNELYNAKSCENRFDV